ncbi:MAG: PKD domain-containing protein, partial [Candidatus Thermoplasmatota archaeon]|nr:PKD domain-containing protein [Candidatus Thermoplasmatota archaeon]
MSENCKFRLFFFTVSIIILHALLPFAVIAEPSEISERVNKKWTFMVYLDADNNLQSYGQSDLAEMKAVGSDSNINIVVLWDGRSNGDGELYYVNRDGVTTFPTSDAGIPAEPDMTDPDTLDSFLEWAISNYPADHYALSIWDHGSGIFRRSDNEDGVKGFCNDEHNGGGELELWELNDVLNNAKTTAGKKLDIIGFDVCFLGFIETHYQLLPYADYAVASEATEPGDGWDYETPLAALASSPDMSPAAFATSIVDAFLDEYSSSITQAAVDLRRLNSSYMPRLEDFSETLTNYMYHYEDSIKDARGDSQTCGNSKSRDLYHFAKNIQQDGSLPSPLRNAATALMNEHQNTVIKEGQKGYSGANGLMIYFPIDGPSGTYTSKIDMSETSWVDFLREYANPQLRYEMLIEVKDDDRDGHDDDVVITVNDFIGGHGVGAEIRVDGVLVGTTDANGELFHFDSIKGPHPVRGLMGNFEMLGEYVILNRPPSASAYIPGSITAGEMIHFDSSQSSDPDGDMLSYMWNFGDGGGSAKADPEHVYDNDGVFSVNLTVIDTDSAKSEPFEFNVIVRNVNPLAEAGDNLFGVEDGLILFDGSGSWDTPWDREKLLYQWDFGDGILSEWSNQSFVNHMYTNDEPSSLSITYHVVLTVKDDDGNMSSDSLEINIQNVVPEANAGWEISRFEDESVTFDGTNSTDTPSDIDKLTYHWDFDEEDGINYTDSTGKITNHTYTRRGSYFTTLMVTDDNNESSVDSVKVNIMNVLPTAVMANSNLSLTEDEIHLLDGSLCSDSVSDIDTLYYVWSVDETREVYGKYANISFKDQGIYNITLTLTDDDNDFDTTVIGVEVENVAPIALLSHVNEGEEDEIIVLNASGTRDTTGDMSELIYEWDLDYNGLEFHQDVTTDTPILEHIYISHGDKRVMLRVVDDNGAYDTTVVGFKIINVPPVSNITADEIINGRIILAGTATILFKGSESSDTASDRGNLHYEWSVNGRVLDQENSSFSYTFRDVGEYELSLKVVDDDGDVDVSKITVVVEPPPGIFSNAGMALYIPLAIVFLLIPLIVFIIIRKKRNREGSVDASVKTEP